MALVYIQIIIIITWSGVLCYTIVSPEARSVEGDPMVWPHPRDVILYTRSSYF